MANVLFDNKVQCYGCSACKNICPTQCITMLTDEEGFLYPDIKNSECIECNKCIGVCQIHQITNSNNFDLSKYYTAQHKNDAILMDSSSGGVFSALANIILEQGGTVYGCVYDVNMKAVQVGIENVYDLRLMRGSKYMQSNMQDCFIQIKELVCQGRKVLFTGTACQIASLKLFLGKEYENLILVDVLCHGVTSPKLFADYVEYLEYKHKGKVVNYEFRNKKKHGWGSEHRSYYQVLKNGRVKGFRPILPAYFCAFFWGLNLRLSCYECKYAIPKRNSDITIGDYWGFYETYKKYFPKGISVVSVNSHKGESIKNDLYKSMVIDSVTFEQATKSNTNFIHPVAKPKIREMFYLKLTGKPYKEISKVVFLNIEHRKLLVSLYGRFVPLGVRKTLRKIRTL